MKPIILSLLGLFLAFPSLRAEQIFVLFDGSCGDRITYTQTNNRQQRGDYFIYHLPFAGGDHLLLETGNEGGTVQNFLPQNYLYCGSPELNVRLAGAVASPEHQVFILLPTPNNQYLIHPVQRAGVLRRRGEVFSYQSELSGFAFDTENGIIGENLATEGNDARVYFEGRETNPCGGTFLFRQLKPGGTYPVIDYKVVPELGLAERHLGEDGLDNSGGSIVARLVNGLPVRNHLEDLCNPGVSQSGPATYGTQQPAPANPAAGYAQPYVPPGQPESRAYRSTAAPGPAPTTINHAVTKGETLYAIARRYGTNVDALKTQNGLTSNTVFPGQRLTIITTEAQLAATAPPAARSEAAALNPTVPTVPYNAGSVANSNPGAAQPTPYGNTRAARGQTAVYGEDTHTVQPGETVASIALKYGYTSAKFRELNDLGPTEIVRVGERLKTDDCNCPAAAPATAPAATPLSREVQPRAYGQAPAPATPQSYDPAPARPQTYGQPATQPRPYGGSAPASPRAYGQPAAAQPSYRAPAGYQAPDPVPAATTARSPEPTVITNNPNFGQVVPDAAAPPVRTMGQLERQTPPPAGRDRVPNPATYNAYPAPAPSPYDQPTSSYTAPRPVPNAYGTPVGATAPAPAAEPLNRSFHLVQEGESLYSIARRYGLTTDQLRQLNQLETGSVIVPFQKLYVN